MESSSNNLAKKIRFAPRWLAPKCPCAKLALRQNRSRQVGRAKSAAPNSPIPKKIILFTNGYLTRGTGDGTHLLRFDVGGRREYLPYSRLLVSPVGLCVGARFTNHEWCSVSSAGRTSSQLSASWHMMAAFMIAFWPACGFGVFFLFLG
ncbi:hypothetical protein Zmor_001089 [Zophobas morio]|uniref:Uncharacterized protein n=1 Tax=Zophobas morio TaxID=2755281 RepID=A0AA38J1D4_9CUCU|nr:hypothetical protein Zmor_001089 [Zophobas morio]